MFGSINVNVQIVKNGGALWKQCCCNQGIEKGALIAKTKGTKRTFHKIGVSKLIFIFGVSITFRIFSNTMRLVVKSVDISFFTHCTGNVTIPGFIALCLFFLISVEAVAAGNPLWKNELEPSQVLGSKSLWDFPCSVNKFKKWLTFKNQVGFRKYFQKQQIHNTRTINPMLITCRV